MDNNDGIFSNMQLAANYATQNSQKGSTGYCARYVRNAIEKGAGISLSGHPEYARDYDTFLQTKGFVVVSKNSLSSPRVGDVAVFEATEGHRHGHIAIFNGTNWVSDFVQSSFWVSKAYQDANNYTILRLR